MIIRGRLWKLLILKCLDQHDDNGNIIGDFYMGNIIGWPLGGMFDHKLSGRLGNTKLVGETMLANARVVFSQRD